MKFKNGDVVEIVFNTCYHGFNIGDKVEILMFTDYGDSVVYEAHDEFGSLWCFTDNDCKAIQGELQ